MSNDADHRAVTGSGSDETRPIGAQIINAFIRAYEKGGVALVLLIIVAICILVGGIGYYKDTSQRAIPLVALSLGFVVLCSFLIVFLVSVYLPAKKIMRSIKDNEELMNAVQDSSLQLADFITQVNNFALLHSDRILEATRKIRETFADVPMVEKFLPMTEFAESEEFGRRVVSLANDARTVIYDIRKSICEADGTRIKAHLQRLRDLNQTLQESIIEPTRRAGATRLKELEPVISGGTKAIDDYKQLVAVLQSNAIILTSLVAEVTDYASRSGDAVSQAILGIKNLGEKFPFAKPLLDNQTFHTVEEIGGKLSMAAAMVKQETGDLEQSIRNFDVPKLVNGAVKLSALLNRLRPKSDGAPAD